MKELKKKAASGVKWTALSAIITTVLQFLQLAVLARILSPVDFGLMAMLMIVLGLAQAFADMGISNAIIHRQDTTREQLSSLYWLNIAAGIFVSLVVVASTPLIVGLFNEPRLEELVFWAALGFLMISVGQQFQILLQKELRFKELALIESLSAFVGALVAILSAMAGHGVLSLIWGYLVNAALRSVMLLFTGWRCWRPELHFNKLDLKGYIGFGLYQMGERSINYFGSRIDQLLLGTLLGAQALGYYNMAFNLVIQPMSRISPILMRVAFPLFATVQDDVSLLRRGYLMVMRVLAMINFPILLGLAAIAPVFVPNVLGESWLPSVILVQLLAIVALLRSTGNPVGALLLARGRADLGFKWNLVILIIQIPGIYVGALLGGAVGIAIALITLQIVFSIFNYTILLRTLIGRCARDYFASMLPALLFSVVMALSVLVASMLAAEKTAFAMAVQIVCGMIVFSTLLFFFQRQFLLEMKGMFFKKA